MRLVEKLPAHADDSTPGKRSEGFVDG